MLVASSIGIPNICNLYLSASTNLLDSILHCLKLISKCACLNGILPFTEPDDWGFVAEDEDTCLRATRYVITPMTCIDKAMRQHCISPWLRHIIRDCFVDVAIEVLPIVLLEHPFVYLRVLGIKCYLPLWV